ncbi:hypothetical protein JHK85_036284 [Glycine max]|nr:hypothetical protein JHK85_036284 [Glycine max]
MDLWRPWSSLLKEVIFEEEKLKNKFLVAFLKWNKKNFYKKKDLIDFYYHMDERDFTDHVMQVHKALKQEKEKWERVVQVELIATLAKEAIA